MMKNNNDKNFRTKWGNRFIIAAIIQGGIMTGMALVTVAFQLLTTDVDIIQFLSFIIAGIVIVFAILGTSATNIFGPSTTEEGVVEIKQADACVVQASDDIPRKISNCPYDQGQRISITYKPGQPTIESHRPTQGWVRKLTGLVMVKSYSNVTSKELKNNSKKEHGTGNRIQVLQSELAWKWEEVIDSVMIVFE